MHSETSYLQDGLVSAGRWCAPYEGPFTRLAKIAVLNALPARDLCHVIFERPLLHHHARPWHGRSLLSDAWLRAHPLRSAVAAEIAGCTLEHLCGAWACKIASDAHLRFCPLCLEGGFQSAVYQIDALPICPIHGQALQAVCPHCAAPTAAYAVTAGGFDCPFHCHACGGPLARNADAPHWESAWRAPKGVQALQPLIAWLNAIKNAPLQWPDVDAWELDPQGDRECERRRGVVAVLRQIVPLKSTIQTQAPVSIHVYRDTHCVAAVARQVQLDDVALGTRRTVYKSLRRHIRKELRIDAAQRTIDSRDFVCEGSAQALLPPPTLLDSSLHGFLLWRQRFEEGFRASERDPDKWARPLRLRPPMAHWPVISDVSLGLWARFVLACLHEDLWTAQKWSQSSHIETTDMSRFARSAAELARLNLWKHRMSAESFPWPISLSHLALQGAGEGRVILFVEPVRNAAVTGVQMEHDVDFSSPLRPAPCAAPSSMLLPAPLERLVLPAALDGTDGQHRIRDEPCRVAASNDREAVQAWILSSAATPSTATVYRSAGERLLNWCWIEKGKALSSLEREDFAEFAQFLANPVPIDRWIGPRAARDSPQWRPFTQPLSPTTCVCMLASIKALLRWLADQRYAMLRLQAGRRYFDRDGISDVPPSYHLRQISRTAPLTMDEWLWIRRALDDLERDSDGQPIRLIVELMYYGSLSWQQISKLTFSSVQPAESDGAWRVWIDCGKEDDHAYPVAAPPPLAHTLRAWLLAHRDMEVKSLLQEPLLAKDPSLPRRLLRPVMTRAAAQARAAGSDAIAESLAHRSARMLKNAFTLHERALLGGLGSSTSWGDGRASSPAENLRRRWKGCEVLWAPLDEAISEDSEKFSEDRFCDRNVHNSTLPRRKLPSHLV